MKKNMRKVLTVVCVVLSVMLMMAFVSSAATTDCGDGKHLTGTRVFEPTCTTGGYTETYCTVCQKVFGTSDHKPELGHDFESAQWVYIVNGNGFDYQAECAREDCNVVTTDGKFYHSVTFVNPWTTETETTKQELSYTSLAKTWKNKELSSIYVVEGSTVASGVRASRQKDYDFGEYKLTGWTLSPADSGKFTEEDLFEFGVDAINKNTVLYAAFTGNPEVYYSVQYYNANGTPITVSFPVRHGTKADDDIFLPDENGEYQNKPEMQEVTGHYYVFSGWSVDINAIYGDVAVAAVYDMVPKMYEYIFCDYLGNEIATETVAYGAASMYSGNAEFAAMMERPKDRTYVYAWKGEFVAEGTVFSTYINYLQAPNGYLDTRYKDSKDYKAIRLIPEYVKRLVEYQFDLTAIIPSSEPDPGYYYDKIVVQILNDKGQYVGGGMTQNVGGKAVFTGRLNDSKYYTITAVTKDEKYHGEKVLERSFIYDETYTKISTTINLQLNEDYVSGNRCSCIHHNALFSGLWVRVLNLLYRLFNVKYVCCDDMYATLGDVLIYTK